MLFSPQTMTLQSHASRLHHLRQPFRNPRPWSVFLPRSRSSDCWHAVCLATPHSVPRLSTAKAISFPQWKQSLQSILWSLSQDYYQYLFTRQDLSRLLCRLFLEWELGCIWLWPRLWLHQAFLRAVSNSVWKCPQARPDHRWAWECWLQQ